MHDIIPQGAFLNIWYAQQEIIKKPGHMSWSGRLLLNLFVAAYSIERRRSIR